MTVAFSVHTTALARVKRQAASLWTSPGEEPDPRHGSTYNGVGWAHSPTPRESPGTVSPSGNPNGVNPAGSGIPSGCRSRLVLRMEGETEHIWTGDDGYVRPQPPFREAREGGLFLRWMLRGSGIARVIGARQGGPYFRCEVGGPAPLTPLLQAQDNHPKQVPRQRAGGLGEVLCGRVWLPGDMPPCGKKNLKMSTIIFCIFWGALFPSLRVGGLHRGVQPLGLGRPTR